MNEGLYSLCKRYSLVSLQLYYSKVHPKMDSMYEFNFFSLELILIIKMFV